MKIILFSFLFTVLFSAQIQSADLKNQSDIDSLIQEIIVLAGNGKTAEGIELLRPYLLIPEAEFNLALAELKKQQPMMTQRFGRVIGTELIKSDSIGESLMKVTFLQKLERYPMKWEIIFYKAADKWIVTKYNVNDSISILFKE